MSAPREVASKVRARLAEQRALVHLLLRQREHLAGSVFERYGQCGKPQCVCRHGQRHGPYLVLSTASGGFNYIDQERAEEARDLVLRYREFRRGLQKLRRLNLELVGLLRRHQAALSRQGQRRLGKVTRAIK